MGKNKQEKYSQIATFPNTFQSFDMQAPELKNNKGETINHKGEWAVRHFGNDHPVVLELACGKGEYTINLGKKYPEKNFIGADIKGNRIWNGAKQALEANLENVAFIRVWIENIDQFFGKNEVDEIWITFPDPYLRKSKATKRLTSPKFLRLYKEILKPEGTINLKTDSGLLYDYTKEMIKQESLITLKDISDVYALEQLPETLAIKTYYERSHLKEGRIIRYLQYKFPIKCR